MGESAVPSVPREPPPAWRRIAAIWRRHARVYGRSFWQNATPAVLEPLFMLASVGLGVGAWVGAKFNGLDYVEFMAPGILATASLYTAAFESTYGTYFRMRYQSTYEAILATPATVNDVVAGELLWCASKGVLYATIVAAVLAAAGFVSSWGIVLVPLFGFVNAIGVAGLGLLVMSRLSNIDTLQVFFTLVVNPMVLVSGFMFPVSQLPGPAAFAARLTPQYHAVETFRLLTLGPEHVSEPWSWVCPFVMVAWAAVLAWLGGLAFRARLLRDR